MLPSMGDIKFSKLNFDHTCLYELAMNNQANIQHNKLMKLDNTMLMYGIYNAETLEKLINTVHEIHNVTSSHEKLFAGEHNPTLFRPLYMDALSIQQYAINSLLFLEFSKISTFHCTGN